MSRPDRKTTAQLITYLEACGFKQVKTSEYGYAVYVDEHMERFPQGFLGYLRSFKAFAGVTGHNGMPAVEVVLGLE